MAHLTNHVVICNWNPSVPGIIEALHPEMLNSRDEEWYPVVIISDQRPEFPDLSHFEDTLLIPGSPLNEKFLLRANVQDAHTIVIVANPSVDDPDDNTLLVALGLRGILESDVERHADIVPRVVAEVRDASRSPVFAEEEITGIHEVVCEADLTTRVMTQANLTPGLTYLVKDLLDYGRDDNEIYMVPISNPQNWIGREIWEKGFSELVRWVGKRSQEGARGSSALLLGVSRTESGRGKSELILNPSDQEWNAKLLPMQPGYKLIILARDLDHARLGAGISPAPPNYSFRMMERAAEGS